MIEFPQAYTSVLGVWVSILLLLAVGIPTSTAADAPAGWLNVKDLGASGSEFETTASTVADSNKITVKDVGDFKAGQEVMIDGCNPHYPDGLIRGPGVP